ncbi:Rhodanese-like protein [Auriscalpium vulgare]|uniref:Rhodanese-like protein n=1 Tax=Auriscalpium vulgare TaxID=40419 RepID=A0ACB8RBZ5_9AGAM|nr:Rhodanese-like protein [Auriscalpium vulgare]
MSASQIPAWATGLPPPRATPPKISTEQLVEMMKTQTAGVDYVVVDVRRTDIEALIKGAINLPAQTFYQTLPTLLPILSRIPKVIFHCQSSAGRGPRCAGWYADALPADARSESLILEGGIKAWLEKFAGDAEMTTAAPNAGADYAPLTLEPAVTEALKTAA